MTFMEPPAVESFDDDITLERWLSPLLQSATHPQIWFIFLDEQNRVCGPIMPCDDLPADPSDPVAADDLGTLPFVEAIAARFAEIMREFDFTQAVVVWERPGSARITERDRAWAAVGHHLVHRGARVRARFLLHDLGLRIFSPDDLVSIEHDLLSIQ